jgi:hypothetical protein
MSLRTARSQFQQNQFVVFFSIAEMVEMLDVNHVNILYAIALMLLSRATKLQVPISEQTKSTLQTWFTQTKNETYTKELKNAWAVGLEAFFKVVSGKPQKEDTFREEVKVTYERRVFDLSNMIDRIAAAIQTATKKEVLVIIDDLDKLDLSVVESIYRDNINALFSPNIWSDRSSRLIISPLLDVITSCCWGIAISGLQNPASA